MLSFAYVERDGRGRRILGHTAKGGRGNHTKRTVKSLPRESRGETENDRMTVAEKQFGGLGGTRVGGEEKGGGKEGGGKMEKLHLPPQYNFNIRIAHTRFT